MAVFIFLFSGILNLRAFAEDLFVEVQISPANPANVPFNPALRLPSSWRIEACLLEYKSDSMRLLTPIKTIARQPAVDGKATFTLPLLEQSSNMRRVYRIICRGGFAYYDSYKDLSPYDGPYASVEIDMVKQSQAKQGDMPDVLTRPERYYEHEATTADARLSFGRRVHVLDSSAPDIPVEEARRVFAGIWRDKKGNEFTLHGDWTASGVIGEGRWTYKSAKSLKHILNESHHVFHGIVIYDGSTMEVQGVYDIPYGPDTATETTSYHGIDLSAGQNVMGISPNPVTKRSASEMFKRVSE